MAYSKMVRVAAKMKGTESDLRVVFMLCFVNKARKGCNEHNYLFFYQLFTA